MLLKDRGFNPNSDLAKKYLNRPMLLTHIQKWTNLKTAFNSKAFKKKEMFLHDLYVAYYTDVQGNISMVIILTF